MTCQDCAFTPSDPYWPLQLRRMVLAKEPFLEQIVVRPLPNEPNPWQEVNMNGIIYLVGLVVVVLAILSFIGLR